jgi:hypothetical protein
MPARQSGARPATPHRIGANNSFFFLLIYLIHFAIVIAGFHQFPHFRYLEFAASPQPHRTRSNPP